MLKMFQLAKANTNSMGKFGQNFQYIFCMYKSYSNQTKKEDFEQDWFKKLTEKDTDEKSSKLISSVSFEDLKGEEKKNEILRTWKLHREQGKMVPNKITEKFMEILMRCESHSHLTKTLA
jgi:hypothetical protein